MKTVEQMIERQRVLAEFGDFALRSDDLQEVLTEACRLVVRGLGSDFAKVVEIQEDESCLLVRAGVGWKPGIVGEVQISMDEQTSEAHAIDARKPIITPDISKEERFEFPDFMKDHGIVAIVNVPIFMPGGGAYGLLQVDSVEARDYDEEDIEFLRTYAVILGPVIDRLHKVHDLRQSLEAQQRLLSELQHRVRNNIGVISSLVRMRSKATPSPETAAELTAIGQRIEALRLVHEQLYIGGTSDRLHLQPYISELLKYLLTLHKDRSGPVRLEVEVAEVELSPEIAVPLGLIANEFVTNSLKHAFHGKGGLIAVHVEPMEDDLFRIRLFDNGKGMPEQPSVVEPGSGLGLGLIDGLARQIGAQAQWTSSPDGTELCLEFTPG